MDQRFVDALKELRGSGQERPFLLDELGERLAEVIDAVQATSKKAKITLTLEVAPRGKLVNSDAVDVIPTVKTTLPEPEAPPVMMFIGKEPGVLTRNDPNQGTLDLRPVAARPSWLGASEYITETGDVVDRETGETFGPVEEVERARREAISG